MIKICIFFGFEAVSPSAAGTRKRRGIFADREIFSYFCNDK